MKFWCPQAITDSSLTALISLIGILDVLHSVAVLALTVDRIHRSDITGCLGMDITYFVCY